MTRTVTYRVEVIRNGAPFGELKSIGAPSVDAQLNSDIKMSMSGTFLDTDKSDFTRDWLRLVMVIDDLSYSVGEFYVGTKEVEVTEQGTRHMRLECYDGAYLLQNTRTETRLHFSAGASYASVIDGLLMSAGIYRRIFAPTSAVLLTDREDWEIGTPYLTIINQLLQEISFSTVRFDANGYALLQPLPELTAANATHHYGRNKGNLVVRPAKSSVDMYGQPNVFIVVCANPDLAEPMTAIAVNDSPVSSMSTVKTGRRIAQLYKVDNIASQADLDAYAEKLRNESIMRGQTIEIETQADPGHSIGEIVTLQHPEFGGVYRETSWSLTPREPTMRHTLERLVVV